MKMSQEKRSNGLRDGFSMMEVIVVCLILSIAIAPMILSFVPARAAVGTERRVTVLANRARGTLNRLRAEDYDTLLQHAGNPVNLSALFGSTNQAWRETVFLEGTNYVPTVVVQDVSGTTGGLLEIVVTVDDVTMRTLKAEY
jgi:prepilin-type N-terminal cleavage/methylation domain-containing protein